MELTLTDGTERVLPPITYYHNCRDNLMAALRDRVLCETPPMTDAGYAILKRSCQRMKRHLRKVTPWDLDRVVNHYKGAKRVRYQHARERYEQEGVTLRDARVDLFVKSEATPITSTYKAPRAIQPRSYVYGVALAQYIKPIEEVIYRMKGFCQRGVPPSRIIAKGLNQMQRAQLLFQKLRAFVNPVAASLDAKGFDYHFTKKLLQLEHSIYLWMCYYRELQRLLNMQLHNKGRVAALNLLYEVVAKRMSGDQNTAVGNCIAMLIMCESSLHASDYVRFDVLDDGDDIIVILEKDDMDHFLTIITEHMALFGQEIKIENVAEKFEDLEWCQCHPVEVDHDTWKLVRDPFKILAKGLCGTKYFNNPDDATRRRLVNSIGQCERVLNLGVPVLQAYAEMCIRVSKTDEMLKFDSVDEYYHRIGKELDGMGRTLDEIKAIPVTDLARESFERAFKISIDDQLHLESLFGDMDFEICGGEEIAEEIDIRLREAYFRLPTSIYPIRE